ncbi:hypothetical protein FRB95_009176 [Tulasnella sp. JGI-2019a]|nr:hypothetical protein FRB95_009176 [Tulasnella sp. JGI-2019a]
MSASANNSHGRSGATTPALDMPTQALRVVSPNGVATPKGGDKRPISSGSNRVSTSASALANDRLKFPAWVSGTNIFLRLPRECPEDANTKAEASRKLPLDLKSPESPLYQHVLLKQRSMKLELIAAASIAISSLQLAMLHNADNTLPADEPPVPTSAMGGWSTSLTISYQHRSWSVFPTSYHPSCTPLRGWLTYINSKPCWVAARRLSGEALWILSWT